MENEDVVAPITDRWNWVFWAFFFFCLNSFFHSWWGPSTKDPSFVWIQLYIWFQALLYNNRLIGLVGRVFANGPEDLGSIPGRVIPKTLKMVLDTSLLNTLQYKVSRVKWSNPEKGVAPSSTHWCSSY